MKPFQTGVRGGSLSSRPCGVHRVLRAGLLLVGALGAGCEGALVEQLPLQPEPPPYGAEGQDPQDATSTTISGQITQYNYTFNLTSAVAASSVNWQLTQAGNCASMPYALASAPTRTLWNGGAATHSLSNGLLSVCGPGSASGSLVLESQHVVPEQTQPGLDVGFSRKAGLGGGSFSYLLSWIGGCDNFGPCEDATDRLANFAFQISHPPQTTVLCPGVRTELDSTTTKCELINTRAPTYSAFFVAANSNWVRSSFSLVDGVDIVFYEAPGGRIVQSVNMASLSQFMRWLTGLLGPYPYGQELRVAGGPIVWAGFEHPANIILNENLPSLSDLRYANPTQHILMHEIVHQWAGNRTTLSSPAEYVWKEAIAEYLTYVFEEQSRPVEEAPATRAVWDSNIFVMNYPRPLDNPLPPLDTLASNVTGVGPMVLFLQLEPYLGRPVILQAIKNFLATPGFRSVEVLRLELQAAASCAGTSVDLLPYFNTWVYGSGEPLWASLSAAASAPDSQGEVTVTLRQTMFDGSDKVYGGTVQVQVRGPRTETVTFDFGLAPTLSQRVLTKKINVGGAVVALTVDPDRRFLSLRGVGITSQARMPVATSIF